MSVVISFVQIKDWTYYIGTQNGIGDDVRWCLPTRPSDLGCYGALYQININITSEIHNSE